MKRILLLIFAAIIVAAAAAVTVVWLNTPLCSDRATEQRAPIEDMFAIYVDIEQLVEKGAIENFITPEYRRMIATMASANIENPEEAAYLESVVNDLSQLGLNLSQPAYVYGNYSGEEIGSVVVIVEVADVAKLDRFFNTFIEEGNPNAVITRNGDNRVIMGLDSTAIMGYNSTRLAVVISQVSAGELQTLTADALARPLSDLSIFGSRDVAAYIDIAQALDVAEALIEAEKQREEDYAYEYAYDYEVEGYNATIAEYDAMLEQIAAMRELYADNATIIAGLTFDEGRATIDVTTDGFDTSIYTDNYARTSNANLQYVEDSAIAVVNMGIKGVNLSEYLNENMPANLADMLDMSEMAPTEFNVMMAVVLDMIETINGDVMIALNDIGLGSGSAALTVDAVATFDVTDNYIYSMATQFGTAMLHPAGENLYTFRFAPFTGYFGQQENTLFASLGSPLTVAANPATNCDWYQDVAGSYSYIVVDIENLMQNELVSMTYSMMLAGQNSDMELINNFVELSDYVYLKLAEPNRTELTVVLKNREVNALQQIIEQLVAGLELPINPAVGNDSI